MLLIDMSEDRFLDEETGEEFVLENPIIRLEHSLLSMSSYESIFEVPFIPPDNFTAVEKTEEQLRTYVSCMLLDDAPEYVLDMLWYKYGKTIEDYILAPCTATTFYNLIPSTKKSREYITSELIYSWMIEFGIDKTCEQWHLNRLLSLIKILNIRRGGEKATKAEILARNRALNAKRLAEMNTTG